MVVTNGYIQGLGLVCRALAASGARRIAIEDPSPPEQGPIAARAGLEPVPVPVDAAGWWSTRSPTDADAVVLTPAHQHPTGVVLTPSAARALLAWLREHDAVAIEDDYDAEYRYDRAAVGALQGLEPDRVVYGGSASEDLAPALRLGWMAVPAALLDAVRYEKSIADQTDRPDRAARDGGLHRPRRARSPPAPHAALLPRAPRRDRRGGRARAPDATVSGIAAGPARDGQARAARRRGRAPRRVRAPPRRDLHARGLPRGRVRATPTLLLGYAQLPEAAIAAAVAELAAAIRAAA